MEFGIEESGTRIPILSVWDGVMECAVLEFWSDEELPYELHGERWNVQYWSSGVTWHTVFLNKSEAGISSNTGTAISHRQHQSRIKKSSRQNRVCRELRILRPSSTIQPSTIQPLTIAADSILDSFSFLAVDDAVVVGVEFAFERGVDFGTSVGAHQAEAIFEELFWLRPG